MKAETVYAIRDMLKHRCETACANYNKIEGDLIKKYQGNFEKYYNKEERKIYLDAVDELDRSYKILADFENHNWN